MINTTFFLPENVRDKDDTCIEIQAMMPCIPPIETDIFIDNPQFEIEEMYTIKEVTYSIHDNTMSIYLKEYKIRRQS